MNLVNHITDFAKRNWGILLSAFLWLCVWATYNTDIYRFSTPGFPHSALDVLHAVRSLFPLIVLGILIGVFIIKKNIDAAALKGPLGFLGLYTVIGLLASLLLSTNPSNALYWGALYLAAIMVLLFVIKSPHPQGKISCIIWVNFAIVITITFGLIIIFLLRPGVISMASVYQFLGGARPFETIGDLSYKVDIFGTPGTRPTGLGRYAGLASLLIFANFWQPKKSVKIIFFALFAICFPILIFTRARTSIIAFLVAIFFIGFFKARSKINFTFGVVALLLLLAPTNFYQFSSAYLTSEDLLKKHDQVPLAKAPAVNTPPVVPPTMVSVENPIPAKNPAPTPTPVVKKTEPLDSSIVSMPTGANNTSIPPGTVATDNVKDDNFLDGKLLTLSGRTTGIWPEAWGLFLKSPLIGFGFQADRIFLQGQHAHNSLLQALVQSGLIGTAFYVLAFIMSCILLVFFVRRWPSNILLLQAVGIMAYFVTRGITESSAFFSADYLFLVPVMAYMQSLYSQPKSTMEQEKKSMEVLGNKIDIISIKDTMALMEHWIQEGIKNAKWIVVTGMHGIVESHKNKEFQKMLNSADLFVPDGISLVWLAKLKGFSLKSRVSGADLMAAFFTEAQKNGWSSYFYGDTDQTLNQLKEELQAKYPGIKIAGMYSPPFRKLTEQEDQEIMKMINDAKPDVVWIGLGLPKQERWIFEHRARLQTSVVVGVGAAFKFLSGKIKRAPAWVGNMGLEWVWRLIFETKTTWRRVFIGGPVFIWIIIKDFFQIKKNS